MKKKLLLLTFTILCLSTLNAQKKKKKNENPPQGSFVAASHFKDFVPISPMDFEQDVIIYDKLAKKFDTLSIKELSVDKTKIIKFLPNETVYSTVEKHDKNGNIEYGPASITAESGVYIVTLDYAKFTTLKLKADDGGCTGFTKVGVGMRITAKITTFEAGVNVSSLFGLGGEVKNGKMSGQLTVDVIGMESSKITDLITMPVDISEASIQTALQSLSAIKSKIYDDETNLHPQILAAKNTNGECSAIQLLEKVDISGENQLFTEQQKQKQLQGNQIQPQQSQGQHIQQQKN